MRLRNIPICGALVASLLFARCSKDNPIIPPADDPPSISQFTASPSTIREGGIVQFSLSAVDDHDIARAILDYGDPNYKNIDGTLKRDTLQLSGTSITANASHQYQNQGNYTATGTIIDNAGQQTSKTVPVYVNLFNPPQIIATPLSGLESKISKAWIGGLATDSQGDPFTLSFTPLSTDLILQIIADTLRYSLADTNASGTRQLRIRADYTQYGTPKFVTKDIPVYFTPMDDISGTVADYYLNSFLASVNPLVVMKAPYSGWVDLTTGTDIVRALLDASGNFRFPKLTNAPHTLRAFMTNGSDSSYVATLNLAAGDQTVNPKVFTNAGTDGTGHLSLGLLLNSLYRVVNFDIGYANALGILNGVDLKNHGSEFTIYLAAKDTVLPYLPRTDGTMSYGWTPVVQDFLVDYIQNHILTFIPPANRPKIVRGLPTDALPVHIASPFGVPLDVTNDKYIVIMGTHDGRGYVKPWDNNRDGVFESAFVWFGWSNTVSQPPYGLELSVVNQEMGSALVGDGSPVDPALDGKSDFYESITGDVPFSGADQKLLGLFESQTPGVNNKIVNNYFGLPY